MSANLLTLDPVPSIINGAPLSSSSHTYAVARTDGQAGDVHSVSAIGVSEAAQAVTAAHAAAKSWAKTTVAERRAILLKAGELLRDPARQQRYSAIMVEETVMSKNWSMYDLSGLAQSHIDEAAAAIQEAFTCELIPGTLPFGESKRTLVTRSPFGVVLAIAPWNAPFILGVRSVVYALAAGNAVLFKTSEFSPRVHLCVYELFKDAGLPDGVLNVLHVHPQDAPQVVESIVADARVGFVNFTGSTRVGKIISQLCSKYLKPNIMELGGKAHMIVLPDADLDIAANHLIFAGYMHAGQICMSTNNILVHSSIAPKLTEKVSALLKNYKASRSPSSQIRSLFSAQSGQRVQALYDDAIAKGATVVAGEAGFDGALVQPVVLGGITKDMSIFHNETFGPVLGLATFEDPSEAIDIVNANPESGLSASIYGANETQCWMLAREIETGAVHINGPSIDDHGAIPHGGVKLSGYGRFNGKEGIRSHTYTKVVTFAPPHPLPLEHIL